MRRLAALALLGVGPGLALTSAPAAVAGVSSARGSPAGVRLNGRVPAGARVASGLLAVSVEAVSMADGSVVAATHPRHGAYSLPVPPGSYLLVLGIVDLRPGRHGQVRMTPLLNAGGATTRRAVGHRAAVGPGSIGIDTITVSAPPGSGVGSQAQGAIIDGLLPKCKASGRRLLDRGDGTLAALEREQRLSDEGRTVRRIHYQPLTPELIVEGGVTLQASGRPVADISVMNPSTGNVIDHVLAAGAAGEEIARFLRRLGAGLADRDCPNPSATAPPAGGGSTALAPGHVMWEGSYRLTRQRPLGSYEEKASWVARGSFDASGRAGAASVLALSGVRYDESECGRASFAPDAMAKPVPWGLSLTAGYPEPGWKYVFPASPGSIPFSETRPCPVGSARTLSGKSIPVYGVLNGYPSALRQEREERQLEPFEVAPETARTETRRFSWEGIEAECISACPLVSAEMTLTISVNAK